MSALILYRSIESVKNMQGWTATMLRTIFPNWFYHSSSCQHSPKISLEICLKNSKRSFFRREGPSEHLLFLVLVEDFPCKNLEIPRKILPAELRSQPHHDRPLRDPIHPSICMAWHWRRKDMWRSISHRTLGRVHPNPEQVKVDGSRQGFVETQGNTLVAHVLSICYSS